MTHLKLHDPRDKADQMRNIKNHILRSARLLHLTIDAKVETCFRDLGDTRFGNERTNVCISKPIAAVSGARLAEQDTM